MAEWGVSTRRPGPTSGRSPSEDWRGSRFNQAEGFHPSGLDQDTYAELLGVCGSEDRFRLNAQYADGSLIDPGTLAIVREVVQQETKPHVWRKGDVLVLDNMLMAHGRRRFRGPRRIAAALS